LETKSELQAMSQKKSSTLEIEVKFLLPNLSLIRNRLLQLGATLVRPRTYERNIRYDNAWDGLMRQGKLLRLRQDTDAIITYKGDPGEDISSEVRVREELEMTVEDFDMAASILERVGFEPRQVYEKYRETYEIEAVEVVLDEMPFGDFVELEGDEISIRTVAQQLRLDWDGRILTNYLNLFASLKESHQLPFEDLTFENFSTTNHAASDILDYAVSE
jgi:adenylate cyclase class 2